MDTLMQELRARLREVGDLHATTAVLTWDQMTYMPAGGAAARGRQLSTLERLIHDKFTDPAIGHLLDALRPYEESLPHDDDDASLIRVTRKAYEHAVRVPSSFVAQSAQHFADSYDVWHRARPENDFARVRPYLERTVDLSRAYAEFFPGYQHVADPHVDPMQTGIKTADVRRLFAELRAQLVPLVQAITQKPLADDACLHQAFPEAQQLAFGLAMAERYGYDLTRGRMDKTAHPFMTDFSVNDVRITTRVKERDLSESLFSILHETGHAIYGQGVSPAFEGTPLAIDLFGDVHESQSRLWENVVGRSRGCWTYWYPRLQDAFPAQLGNVSLDTFYRAINKVQPSLIRTDADEVTYNLHVMLRFDLGLQLLEGTLTVADLPEAWNARYAADLGVTPPDFRDGVLQDVHWYSSLIGGSFHIYTLGNIMSAQFYAAAVNAHPTIPEEITRGEFATLRGWLTEHVYRHGAKYTPRELLERATRQPLSITPYMTYLRTKYGELYGV